MSTPDSRNPANPAPPTGESEMPSPTPASVSVMIEDGRYVFRNDDGRPMYTYDRDPPGESTCYDACAEQWAPLAVEGRTRTVGDWTVIERADGIRQWAYKGQPVYVQRAPLADSRTEGADGPWRVVTP